MSRKWRVLVVGCGWIACKVHLPYLAGLRRDGELGSLSVADTDPACAAYAADTFGAHLHHGPVEEAGADLVVVATPPAGHAALSLRALAAGAHVITEKPLALTTADAARILAASNRYGRGVYPLYTFRHRAEIPVIRTALDTQYGPVHWIGASWVSSAVRVAHPPGRRRRRRGGPDRRLADSGARCGGTTAPTLVRRRR